MLGICFIVKFRTYVGIISESKTLCFSIDFIIESVKKKIKFYILVLILELSLQKCGNCNPNGGYFLNPNEGYLLKYSLRQMYKWRELNDLRCNRMIIESNEAFDYNIHLFFIYSAFIYSL